MPTDFDTDLTDACSVFRRMADLHVRSQNLIAKLSAIQAELGANDDEYTRLEPVACAYLRDSAAITSAYDVDDVTTTEYVLSAEDGAVTVRPLVRAIMLPFMSQEEIEDILAGADTDTDPDDEPVRLRDGRTLPVSVNALARQGALEEDAAEFIAAAEAVVYPPDIEQED